jgi:hypothetical protein
MLTNEASAKSPEEYIDEAYQLLDQRKFDKALNLLQEGYQIYPGNVGLFFAIAECYHNIGDYEAAITNYLNLISAIEEEKGQAPGKMHFNLVDVYTRLGQKHYFSSELCLRIIYHAEKMFELTPEMAEDRRHIEFLNRSIGYYGVAIMGKGNVKMVEAGGDGLEFDLPYDNIGREKKMAYLTRAKKRVNDFESQEKAGLYPTVKSDRTVQDVIKIFEQKIRKINSVHFRKTDAGRVVEEIFYQYPDKFKGIDSNAVSIVSGNKYYFVDKNTGEVVDEQTLDLSDADVLESLLVPNLSWISKYCDLEVERLERIPDFLKDFYGQGFANNLYLVTAKLKDEEESPFYHPIARIEYFIDVDLGLAAGIRNYWSALLGSGKQDELASETIISAVQKTGHEDLYLPETGTTMGYVQELINLNEKWDIEIISIGEFISGDEFRVDRYQQ